MGLVDGREALIFGVATDHSIAWGIAKALHEEGAIVGFSSVDSLLEKRVRPLAASIGSDFVEPADVQSDEQIRAVMQRWQAAHGQIDILVRIDIRVRAIRLRVWPVGAIEATLEVAEIR
jgi:enoyl-[acyl-carrier protein] reductase I